MAKTDEKGKEGAESTTEPGAESTTEPRAPSLPSVDASWDDDTAPHLDLDDSEFNRVTVIPDFPSELLAKQMMMDSHDADEGTPISGLFERSKAQTPTLPVQGKRSPVPLELESAPASRLSEPNSFQPGGVESDVPRAVAWSGFDGSAPPPSEPSVRAITDRYAMGDFSGTLVLAEALLETTPDHAEALHYADKCRDVLMQMYAARLGPLDQVVRMAIPSDQIRWLSLDHRAGFLLSLVDGICSVEELLDISGMQRLDALRILFTMLQERVIRLSARSE